jgi:S-adenosylmethionine synthetase
MENNLVLRTQPVARLPVEVIERKGLGHPDTICDALSENLSRNLCRWYLDQTGKVLHHNLDKALLRGGKAHAVFGGGQVTEPIDIYFAGRAVTEASGKKVPIEELAIEGSRTWLKEHLHALDVEKHVRIHCLVRPGSDDLSDLFSRGGNDEIPKANDTSFGVGYAPLNSLEQAVLDAGDMFDRKSGPLPHLARGEDTKIMAIRHDDNVEFTVACAMIAPFLSDEAAYRTQCHNIVTDLDRIFKLHGFDESKITVNAADDPARDSYYLTVTGTSAESGDDGQIGRGNRANGLITPFRAMSLEAVCGKNPINHVGKLYNVAAREIAQRLVTECPSIVSAQCCLVSQIGQLITQPGIIDIAISTLDDVDKNAQIEPVHDIATSVLNSLPTKIHQFINGDIRLY